MPDAPEEPDCLTAFLVVQASDGNWYATPHLTPTPIPMRPPEVHEMKSGCTDVVSDIEASKVAQIVISQMLSVTAKMREEAHAADLAARLRM